jgi:hypothetical protein
VALVVDQLQLWTIGFKWSGLDPSRVWLRVPAAVRDNFSTLLEAIYSEHLDCLTLASEKYAGDDPELSKFYIRYWLDDVNAGVNGTYYSRRLLRWAIVERGAFQDWCERRTISLPEFWFPPGWTDYRWPEYDPRSAEAIQAEKVGPEDSHLAAKRHADLTGRAIPTELRDNQIARIASQQIARVLWRDEPGTTIAAMVKDDRVQRYGGARFYADETVRRWVQEVAPAEVSAKKGRPKKKTPAEDA